MSRPRKPLGITSRTDMKGVYATDAEPGMAWKCPDCGSQVTQGWNAHFHAVTKNHGRPELVKLPTKALELPTNVDELPTPRKHRNKSTLKKPWEQEPLTREQQAAAIRPGFKRMAEVKKLMDRIKATPLNFLSHETLKAIVDLIDAEEKARA